MATKRLYFSSTGPHLQRLFEDSMNTKKVPYPFAPKRTSKVL